MLTEHHCDLFNRPFFQFSQLKRYCPEQIEPLKAAYKSAWQDWRETVLHSASLIDAPFTTPHIERWCNGWQLRAHFFAFFKYEIHQNSAAILSLILNRRRLTVALDWHAYRATQSDYRLDDYHNWLNLINNPKWQNFELWRGSDNEYADHSPPEQKLPLANPNDFYRIGKHLQRDELAQRNAAEFIAATIKELLPLYEAAHETRHI